MIRRILPSIFKVSLMSMALIGFSQKISAQTATINYYPTGTSPNIVAGQSTYHASESVYVESEIGAGNFTSFGTAINKIAFLLSSTTATTLPVTLTGYQIYMKNVTASDSVFATGTYALTGYTQVYNGPITISSKTDWTPVNLTTPFVRTAGSNVKVLILRTVALPTGGTGLVFIPSVGFGADAGSSATTSSRRYNNTTALVANSTSLTATNFRPAIQFISSPASDVRPSNIVLPVSSCYSTPQNLSVTITNSGSANAIAAGAVTVKLNVYGPNATSFTQTSGAAIAVGASQTIAFNNVSLNAIGSNFFEAITSMTGDGDASNDTLVFTNTTYKTITTFPRLESAEEDTLQTFSHVRTLAGSNLWTLGEGFNNPDLSDTVPPIDGGVCYVFDNWSSGTSTSGFSSRLFSDCISLPAGMPASNYQLSYFLSHDTSWSTLKDSIYVSVSADKGTTWTRIKGYQRFDANYTTAGWGKDSVSLSAYAGQTIMIGFEGVSKWGNMQGLDMITIDANYPLPVSLTAFSGVREGSKNVLSWSTATEQNNKGFELQRSINGKDFSAIAFIDTKSLNGSSSSVNNYSYVDEKPSAATNYYRLRQLDKDGKSNLSNVVVLKSAQIKVEISRVFPNPVQDKLNIVLNTVGAEKITVSITDLAGRVISSKSMETVQGDNNISFNTASLAKGTYLIKVNSSSNSELATQKFVKP